MKFTIEFPDEEEDETEEEEIECIMQVKMYECNDNEFLLGFKKKQGDLEVFYDNFLKIKEIIKKMLV